MTTNSSKNKNSLTLLLSHPNPETIFHHGNRGILKIKVESIISFASMATYHFKDKHKSVHISSTSSLLQTDNSIFSP
jgi:hypothetical protein